MLTLPPMKALLRPLLLWFLLAGIPFQGFAAAAMLHCALTGMPAPHATAPSHAMQAGVPHDHAAMLAAGHARHVADQPHDGRAKCAGAGACCTGAPIAPSLPAPPPLQDGRCATVPFVAAAPAAVDLAGLERPPKFPPA